MKSTKRINPTKRAVVKVASAALTIKEDLPFQYVYYPDMYGTFIGFSETENSQVYFCECSKQAIYNYQLLVKQENIINKEFLINNKLTQILGTNFFDENLGLYKPKLCHRCNQTTPSIRYCHEMYGGNFKQFFGWYINQTFLRLGIFNLFFLKGYTPKVIEDEIARIILLQNEFNKFSISLDSNITYGSDRINFFDKEIGKLTRALYKNIENITREEFGFRKVGEGNVSETILINIISNIYKSSKIIKHYRPSWLEGLELDVFLPEENIGFEYQGQQHFYPIKAWGGESALQALRKRDQRKRIICKNLGVKLIEIDFTEPLEAGYILKKIKM
jgi:hypothetical protein